jgi:protein phosphatase
MNDHDQTTPVDLPSPSAISPLVQVAFGARTDIGKVRPQNEDHFLVARMGKVMRVVATSLVRDDALKVSEDRGILMVVADGMGGHAAGEIASALAISSVESFVLNSLKWFMRLGGAEESALMRELRKGLEQADKALLAEMDLDPALAGMGTTLTLAFSVADDLYVAHAGDSRAYVYRDGQLDQLTTDHTLAQHMVEVGLLTPEAARRDRSRHAVTNALGAGGGVRGEIDKLRLKDGDVVLLCTDGLTDLVDDERIAEVLARHLDPEAACNRLVELALENGGRDNVTVVAARYSFLTPGDVRNELFARRALVTGVFVKLLESIDGSAPHDEAEARRQLRTLGWSVDTVLPP